MGLDNPTVGFPLQGLVTCNYVLFEAFLLISTETEVTISIEQKLFFLKQFYFITISLVESTTISKRI